MKRIGRCLFVAVLLAIVPMAQAQEALTRLFEEAQEAEATGDFAWAAQVYDRLLKIAPETPGLFYLAGRSHAQAGQPKEALDRLEEAVRLEPLLFERLGQDPALAALREQARWPAFAERARARVAGIDPLLRAELVAMREADQKVRNELFGPAIAEHGPYSPHADSAKAVMLRIDRAHTTRMKVLVEKHGWPGFDLVGFDGAGAAFLIVQHAPDSVFQSRALHLLRTAAEQGEATLQDVALLHDRVLRNQDKPQLYGTQFEYNEAGEAVLAPLEDVAHVDERRATMGLPPLADYLEQQGLLPAPPEQE